jgi:hypothetical protein
MNEWLGAIAIVLAAACLLVETGFSRQAQLRALGWIVCWILVAPHMSAFGGKAVRF